MSAAELGEMKSGGESVFYGLTTELRFNEEFPYINSLIYSIHPDDLYYYLTSRFYLPVGYSPIKFDVYMIAHGVALNSIRVEGIEECDFYRFNPDGTIENIPVKYNTLNLIDMIIYRITIDNVNVESERIYINSDGFLYRATDTTE